MEAERETPRNWNGNSMRTVPRYQRQANEISAEQIGENNGEEDAEIEAINEILCWNCREVGHMWKDCPLDERALFSYRCGKPDVTSRNCPKFGPGNTKKSVMGKGESRSNDNPPK